VVEGLNVRHDIFAGVLTVVRWDVAGGYVTVLGEDGVEREVRFGSLHLAEGRGELHWPAEAFSAHDEVAEKLFDLITDLEGLTAVVNRRQRIQWLGFFDRERVTPEYSVPYLLPKGRQVALVASHKVGKSLLSLDVTARTATGKSVLGQEPREPRRALYLDMEMLEEDVFDRLSDMGFGPEDEELLAQNLFYYPLSGLPPLDTEAGSQALIELLAEARMPEFVVIDTMSRVISGRENDSDTTIAFYRHTGRVLKAAGIGLLRLDHEGRDSTRGARGSSAKGDDVDVVYQLKRSRTDGEFTLSHGGTSRVPWMADDLVLRREADPVRFTVTEASADDSDRYADRNRDDEIKVVAVISQHPDALQQEIIAQLSAGMGRERVRRAIQRLINHQVVVVEPGRGMSVKHRLAPDIDDRWFAGIPGTTV